MNECICKDLRKTVESQLHEVTEPLRKAVCHYCGHEVISVPDVLPFFRRLEDKSHDDTLALGPNPKIGLVYHGNKGYDKTAWSKVK